MNIYDNYENYEEFYRNFTYEKLCNTLKEIFSENGRKED